MAPKNGKSKPHKSKGDNKKKKEEKVLPSVLDITVETPDYSLLTLKVLLLGLDIHCFTAARAQIHNHTSKTDSF
ncbi:hypothetical protein C5167_012804 [Papaver somniferum]|uniref:Uncharacterized protein n=1 Tax=Papaver somniferum TaxID=3469 RepID=A0A4Y7IZD1_PAPSO|nr:hypothetical protein C5167_012804 [Papaver somniferum]